MVRQYELVDKVKSYDPQADEDLLNRAYVYAMKAHGPQKRANGDPYFSHPLEVAGILTDLKLDTQTIITALLHDTVEDTDATLDEIGKLFGPDVRRLVDGVTKLNKLELQSSETKQAENLRKLVMALSEDIRVLLVKLADRLHNMRTLHFIASPEKRARIARETLDIYAPLAERIGLERIKDELQDLSFKEAYVDAAQMIEERLSALREQGQDLAPKIQKELTKVLAKGELEADISGREKTPYSIWKKMQGKNMAFEQLSDIMAFRIMVDNVGQCYQALGILHSTYPVVPGRFKDYISTPKPNGYQSLHTGIIGPFNQKIEIQIRTKEMHEVADLGVAAHWIYKQRDGSTEGKQYAWVRDLLDILENAENPQEFLENTKMNMFQDEVFCFTPKGDLISLPKGATPVDFAYAIHSKVGDTCVGAKVNGKIVPLKAELHNGDVIEVITDKNRSPSPDWEQFVVTGRAKTRIRRFIRQKKRDEYAGLGREILQKLVHKYGRALSDKAINTLLKKHDWEEVDDLYAALGAGEVKPNDLYFDVFPEFKKEEAQKAESATKAKPKKASSKFNESISIEGLIPGMAIHFAKCCHPLPGDPIVGVITTGRGVTIHTEDCVSLEVYAKTPERILDISWGADHAGDFIGRLHVIIDNVVGSIGNLTTMIAKEKGDIQNFKLTNRTMTYFEVLVDIKVKNRRELDQIIAALRGTPTINSVERIRA